MFTRVSKEKLRNIPLEEGIKLGIKSAFGNYGNWDFEIVGHFGFVFD